MREPTVATDSERKLAGVIDTLSQGYATVNRHPWILGIPVLVDLLFWLGPRVTLAPLVERAFARLTSVGLSAELAQSYEESREGVLQVGESFNLLSLLVTHFPGIPSLMAAREGSGSATAVDDLWTAVWLSLLLLAVGIWLASAYYVAVAMPVRGVAEESHESWARVWRSWRRLVKFLLGLIGASLLLGLPLGVLAFLLGGTSAPAFGLLVLLVWVAALWLQFFLFFVVDAVVLGDVGPLQAVRNSLAVVKFNTGSALRLVALIWLITLGMPLAWDVVARSPIGIVVGIVGNAYVSAGLAVASMIYYRDRFAALSGT